MIDTIFYQSADATVTNHHVVIRDLSFPLSEIDTVSTYDDRDKIKRFGPIGAIAAVGLVIAFLAGGNARSSLSGNPALLIALVIAGAFVVYTLASRVGLGLIIEMADGRTETVVGIPRADLQQVCAAIELALATKNSAGPVT